MAQFGGSSCPRIPVSPMAARSEGIHDNRISHIFLAAVSLSGGPITIGGMHASKQRAVLCAAQ